MLPVARQPLRKYEAVSPRWHCSLWKGSSPCRRHRGRRHCHLRPPTRRHLRLPHHCLRPRRDHSGCYQSCKKGHATENIEKFLSRKRGGETQAVDLRQSRRLRIDSENCATKTLQQGDILIKHWKFFEEVESSALDGKVHQVGRGSLENLPDHGLLPSGLHPRSVRQVLVLDDRYPHLIPMARQERLGKLSQTSILIKKRLDVQI